MAYRRSTKDAHEWRQWIAHHKERLSNCGLPDLVLSDEDHWWDFLDHGFLDHHPDPSNFDVESLTPDQSEQLLDFLEAELTKDELPCVFADLRSIYGWPEVTLQLLDDADRHPDLFCWYGGMSHSTLRNRLKENGLIDLPTDICSFWLRTGGGDFFEAETILSPSPQPKADNDVLGVNGHFRGRGLGSQFLVFHTGWCVSAIRRKDQKYVCLREADFFVVAEYPSLNEWYRCHIRAEYEDRYALDGRQTP